MVYAPKIEPKSNIYKVLQQFITCLNSNICLHFIQELLTKMIAEIFIVMNQCAQNNRYFFEFYRPVKWIQHLNESPGKFRESTNSAKGIKFFNGLQLQEGRDFYHKT